MALPLGADIGTIGVEAVVGSVGEEGRENTDDVDSRGIAVDDVAEEVCRASRVVSAHCEEE